MKIPLLVWACLLHLCLWSTKGEVYNHTNSFQVFVTQRSFPAEIPWISSRKHILNVWSVGICKEAETQMLYSGENQDLSLHQTTLSGWEHSNIVVKFLLFPSFIFFLSDNINIFGPYLRKQLTPAFTPDMVGHPNSGLQGAHLAPILALLLTFHVVSAKSHQFNIPLHRSKDMISPFAHISATTAATSTSNNPLFTKSPPLDQGFSNKARLSLGNTSGLLTHLLFAALEHSFQARIKLWFCQAKSRIWEQTWIPVCPRFNEQLSFKFLEYQTGRGRGHWAISHVSLPEDKAYRYFDSKISPFSFSINKM